MRLYKIPHGDCIPCKVIPQEIVILRMGICLFQIILQDGGIPLMVFLHYSKIQPGELILLYDLKLWREIQQGSPIRPMDINLYRIIQQEGVTLLMEELL